MFNLRRSTSDVQKLSLRNDAMEPGTAERGKINVSEETGQLDEKDQKYSIDVNGTLYELNKGKIAELIKEKLKNSRVVNNTFRECGVSIDQLDNLQIIIEQFEDKVAETDGVTMKISPNIIKDILTTNFYIVLHEICGHFVIRKAEEKKFFQDPEEVLGMAAGCAGMIEQGYDLDKIWNTIWPKISFHFHDEIDAREFMKKIFEKAKNMI